MKQRIPNFDEFINESGYSESDTLKRLAAKYKDLDKNGNYYSFLNFLRENLSILTPNEVNDVTKYLWYHENHYNNQWYGDMIRELFKSPHLLDRWKDNLKRRFHL